MTPSDFEARLRQARTDCLAGFRSSATKLALLADAAAPDTEAIRDIAHRIAGTAGSFGFTDISRLARTVLERDGSADPEDRRRAVHDLVKALNDAV